MKRLLFTAVGSSDPFGRPDAATGAPTAGPILTLLDHLERGGAPLDSVVLAVTIDHLHQVELEDGRLGAYRQSGMEANADRLEDELKRRPSPPRVQRIALRVNPTSVDEVIDGLQKGLRSLRLGQAEMHVNLTSGTPAMMTALVFLADAGPLSPAALWQVLDPGALRDHQTGEPLPARRVQRVELAHLAERARVERSLALLRGMAFDFAASELRELAGRTLVDRRRIRARAVEWLARAWGLWHRAEFGDAHRAMIKANSALRRARMAGVREAIDAQREALAAVVAALDARTVSRSGTPEAVAVLRDAYAAILRRASAGDTIGMAAWTRILLEGVLDYWLGQAGLSPRGVTAGELAKLGRANAKARAAVEVAVEAARLPASGRTPIDLHALDLGARRTLVIELVRGGAVADLEGSALAAFDTAAARVMELSGRPSAPRAAQSLLAAATRLIATVRSTEGEQADVASTPFGTSSLLAAVDAIEREL